MHRCPAASVNCTAAAGKITIPCRKSANAPIAPPRLPGIISSPMSRCSVLSASLHSIRWVSLVVAQKRNRPRAVLGADAMQAGGPAARTSCWKWTCLSNIAATAFSGRGHHRRPGPSRCEEMNLGGLQDARRRRCGAGWTRTITEPGMSRSRGWWAIQPDPGRWRPAEGRLPAPQ